MRAVFGIGTLLIFGLVPLACRTLLDPESDSSGRFETSAVILDPGGLGLKTALVAVESQDGSRFSWSGITNKLGRIELEVPSPGPYSVRVRPDNARVPGYTFGDVYFDRQGIVLRYDLDVFNGSISVPPDFLPLETDSWLAFSYRISGQNVRSASLKAELRSDGTFAGYTDGGQYVPRVRLRGPVSDVVYSWPDSIRVLESDDVVLRVPLQPVTLVTTMGGRAPPLGSVDINLRESPATAVFTRTDLRPSLTTWSLVGSVNITIRPGPNMPFLPYSGFFDIGVGGTEVNVELGRYRADIRLVDTNRDPVAGGEVRVGNSGTLTTDASGWMFIYLPEGDYEVTAAWPGQSLDTVGALHVSADATAEFVLQ